MPDNEIDLSADEEAVDAFQFGRGAVEYLGLAYTKVGHPTMVVSQRRWATVYRQVFHRSDDDTWWGFDWEESHSESVEPWSYISPHLVRLKPVQIQWWEQA